MTRRKSNSRSIREQEGVTKRRDKEDPHEGKPNKNEV